MIDAAWTDFVLALVTTGLGFRLMDRGGSAQTVGVGLLLVGVAAWFGVARFLLDDPSLEGAHRGVTAMATLVGMPLVGVGYLSAGYFPQYAEDARRYAFVVLLVGAVFLLYVERSGVVLGAIAMALVVAGAVRGLATQPRAAMAGLVGAAGVVLSGLVVNGPGEWGPMSRLAWFHLALAGSCGLLGLGVLSEPPAEPSA